MNAAEGRTEERVVIVTGSAGGIGREIMREFSDQGDRVVGLDIVDGVDVTDPEACRAVASDVLAEHGRIDVLCNVAGVGASGDALSATPEEWTRVFSVNVFGVAYLTAAVLPAMREARRGAIVNITSILADIGFVDRVVYSASKGALLAMTRAIAADEARNGIRANAVSPATVDGPWVRRNAEASGDADAFMDKMRRRQPLGDLITAQEVAKAVVFVARPDISLTGIELPVDAGVTGLRLVD